MGSGGHGGLVWGGRHGRSRPAVSQELLDSESQLCGDALRKQQRWQRQLDGRSSNSGLTAAICAALLVAAAIYAVYLLGW